MNKATIWWATLATLAIGWLWVLGHYRYNDSPSVKEGLYKITYGPYRWGTDVMLSTPMKQIVGLPGDTFAFTPQGLYRRVSGKNVRPEIWELLPNSAPEPGLDHFPFGFFVVPKGMFFGMGPDSRDSWDSRYIGPIPLSLIVANLEQVK